MASRVLETIVRARDEASNVLKHVGDSAQGAGEKLKGMDSLADSARGLKSTLRTAKTMAIAFEVIPVGVDAVNAAMAALSGTAEQSAAAQQTLLESIKSFPIVGKLAGEAAEYFSDKVANLFGKQTTGEVLAEVKAREDTLKAFATEVPKIFDKSRKMNNDAGLIGLMPSAAEIEKSKQKLIDLQHWMSDEKQADSKSQIALQEKIDEQAEIAHALRVKAEYQKRHSALHTESGMRESDKEATLAERELQNLIGLKKAGANDLKAIDKIGTDGTKLADEEQAKAKVAALRDQREYEAQMIHIAASGNQQLADLASELASQQLDGENRGYEARASALRSALARQTEAMKLEAKARIDNLQSQNDALQLLADKGNQEAQDRIYKNQGEQHRISQRVDTAVGLAASGSSAEQSNARDAEIREATLASLSAQADAGDVAAGLERDRLTTARQREAAENALRAIGKDQLATDQQKADAAKQLAAIGTAGEKVVSLNLATSELEILKQRASLGDVEAGIRAHNIELDEKQIEAEAKLNAMIANRDSNAADRANARAQIDQMKANRQKENDNTVRDSALFVLQQEAALGDKQAERQLKKIELEKAFTEQRQKALAVLKDDHSTQQQKDNAKKSLSGMDAVEKAALSRLGGGEKPNQLASLVDEHYLTGAQASAAQEKDPYQPIVDAQNKNNDLTKTMIDLLKDYLPYLQPSPKKALT